MAVRDGQHLNDGRKLSINQRKWKSPQKELSRAVNPSWPTLRSLSNAGDRAAHFTRKSGSRARASLPIPVKSRDRKSTRLNSSHSQISYAVFCLKKKKKTKDKH